MLVSLDLSSNKINGSGFDALVKFISLNTKLHKLNLKNNSIINIDILLKNLSLVDQLYDLNLEKNPIPKDKIELIKEKLNKNYELYLSNYKSINKERLNKLDTIISDQ